MKNCTASFSLQSQELYNTAERDVKPTTFADAMIVYK